MAPWGSYHRSAGDGMHGVSCLTKCPIADWSEISLSFHFNLILMAPLFCGRNCLAFNYDGS